MSDSQQFQQPIADECDDHQPTAGDRPCGSPEVSNWRPGQQRGQPIRNLSQHDKCHQRRDSIKCNRTGPIAGGKPNESASQAAARTLTAQPNTRAAHFGSRKAAQAEQFNLLIGSDSQGKREDEYGDGDPQQAHVATAAKRRLSVADFRMQVVRRESRQGIRDRHKGTLLQDCERPDRPREMLSCSP